MPPILDVARTVLIGLHGAAMVGFGYVLPALSSVKAVVQNDADAFRQWTTYWLILSLYTTVLSPFLSVAIHPALQLLVILWLSLPKYRGATRLYETILVPRFVSKYESTIDGAIDDAKRQTTRWVWKRLADGGIGAASQVGLGLRLLMEATSTMMMSAPSSSVAVEEAGRNGADRGVGGDKDDDEADESGDDRAAIVGNTRAAAMRSSNVTSMDVSGDHVTDTDDSDVIECD